MRDKPNCKIQLCFLVGVMRGYIIVGFYIERRSLCNIVPAIRIFFCAALISYIYYERVKSQILCAKFNLSANFCVYPSLTIFIKNDR